MFYEDFCAIHQTTLFSSGKCIKCRNKMIEERKNKEKYVIRFCKKHGVEIFIWYNSNGEYICRACNRELSKKSHSRITEEKRKLDQK